MIRRTSRTHRSARPGLAAGLLLLAVAGCDALDPVNRERGLTADEFVEVVAALRDAEREILQDTHADSIQAVFERRKAEILAEHATTEDRIRAFVARHENRPEVLTEVFERISRQSAPPTPDLPRYPPEDPVPMEEVW